MSILPISGHIQLALSMFTLAGVPVEDVGYERVSGQDKKTTLANRAIDAAIDPASMKQLEKIFGGDVSDGDIAIYTEVELFMADKSSDAVRKQSYVTYSGKVYRVMNIADWLQQAGVYVYQGRRHVAQN